MARQATAEWKGDLFGGAGQVRLGSGAYEGGYSFSTRFGDERGVNPEEMVGGALAACFAMALSSSLATAGFTPVAVHTTADVCSGKDEKGYLITRIDLTVSADVPGVDTATFQRLAEETRTGCIVARALLATPITMKASLR